jgi:hypothetical protein
MTKALGTLYMIRQTKGGENQRHQREDYRKWWSDEFHFRLRIDNKDYR